MNRNYDDVIASLKQSLPKTWHIFGVENKNGKAKFDGQPMGIFLGVVSVTRHGDTIPVSNSTIWKFLKLIEDYYNIAVPLIEINTHEKYPYITSHFILCRIKLGGCSIILRNAIGVTFQNMDKYLDLVEECLRSIVQSRQFLRQSVLWVLPQPIAEEIGEYI